MGAKDRVLGGTPFLVFNAKCHKGKNESDIDVNGSAANIQHI